MYLWIKTFHVFLVIAWSAALFYLPRIFVNLAMVEGDGPERKRLLLMARKLYRFMHGLGGLAIIFGAALWMGFGVGGGWLHAKLMLVALLIVYTVICGRLLRAFEAGTNRRSHRWYRVFNEAPVLVMFAIVALVIIKPF